MVYILVGSFYNRYVLELRGLDQIPRWSFFSFSDTVELVRNLSDRIRHGSSNSSAAWSGRRNWSRADHSYRGMAEEEEAMMAGPPGFLDEQDEEEDHTPAPQAPPTNVEGESASSKAMDENGVIRL